MPPPDVPPVLPSKISHQCLPLLPIHPAFSPVSTFPPSACPLVHCLAPHLNFGNFRGYSSSS